MIRDSRTTYCFCDSRDMKKGVDQTTFAYVELAPSAHFITKSELLTLSRISQYRNSPYVRASEGSKFLCIVVEFV